MLYRKIRRPNLVSLPVGNCILTLEFDSDKEGRTKTDRRRKGSYQHTEKKKAS
jgi:hypothetical protein